MARLYICCGVEEKRWAVAESERELARVRTEWASQGLTAERQRSYVLRSSRHALCNSQELVVLVFSSSSSSSSSEVGGCFRHRVKVAGPELEPVESARWLRMAVEVPGQRRQQLPALAGSLLGLGSFYSPQEKRWSSGHHELACALVALCHNAPLCPRGADNVSVALLLWASSESCQDEVCSCAAPLLDMAHWEKLVWQLLADLCRSSAAAAAQPSLPAAVVEGGGGAAEVSDYRARLLDTVLHRLAQVRDRFARLHLNAQAAWVPLWLHWHSGTEGPCAGLPPPPPVLPSAAPPALALAWEMCAELSRQSGLPWTEEAEARPSPLDVCLSWLSSPPPQLEKEEATEVSATTAAAAAAAGSWGAGRVPLSPACAWWADSARARTLFSAGPLPAGPAQTTWCARRWFSSGLAEHAAWSQPALLGPRGAGLAAAADSAGCWGFGLDERWFRAYTDWFAAGAAGAQTSDVNKCYQLALAVLLCPAGRCCRVRPDALPCEAVWGAAWVQAGLVRRGAGGRGVYLIPCAGSGPSSSSANDPPAPPARFWLRLAGALEHSQLGDQEAAGGAAGAANTADPGPLIRALSKDEGIKLRAWLYETCSRGQAAVAAAGGLAPPAGDSGGGAICLTLLYLRVRLAGGWRLSRHGDLLQLQRAGPVSCWDALCACARQLLRALGTDDLTTAGGDQRGGAERLLCAQADRLYRLQAERLDHPPSGLSLASCYPGWPLSRTCPELSPGDLGGSWLRVWQAELEAARGPVDSRCITWRVGGRAGRRALWHSLWQLQAIDLESCTLVLAPAKWRAWLAQAHPCFTPAGMLAPLSPGAGRWHRVVVVLDVPRKTLWAWQAGQSTPVHCSRRLGDAETQRLLKQSSALVLAAPGGLSLLPVSMRQLLSMLNFSRVFVARPARRSLASIAQAMPGAWSVPRHLVSSGGGEAPQAGGGLGLCRDLPRPVPGQRWRPLQVGYRSMAGGSPALLVAKFHELQALLGGGGALEDAEPSLEPAVRDVWRNRFWQRPRAPRSFGRLSSQERTAVLKGWLIAEHSDWADLRALMLRQQPTKPAKLPSQIWNRLVVEDTCQSSQALAELWELCQQPRNFVRYPLGVRSTLPDILFGRRLRWTRTPLLFSGCLQELGRLANIRGELRMAARTAVLLVRRLDSPLADWPPAAAPAAKCRLLVCDVACSPSSPPLVRWWPREPLAGELARYLLLHLILAAPLQPGCPELSAAWAAAPPALRQGVLETGAGQHEQLQIWHQRDQPTSSSSSSRPTKRKR